MAKIFEMGMNGEVLTRAKAFASSREHVARRASYRDASTPELRALLAAKNDLEGIDWVATMAAALNATRSHK